MADPDKISPQQDVEMKIDAWSLREKLCLASSVLRSGQNWVTVSRSLKPHAEPNRPQDWFSPKNCALQYNNFLEKTGAHRRKRGEQHPSSGSLTESQQRHSTAEIILTKLHQEYIEVLKQSLESHRREYQVLTKELDLVEDGKLDNQLPEICKRIDEENERKSNEKELHLKWSQESELKLAQQVLRSPAQTVDSAEDLDGEMTKLTSRPSIKEQLNIDVSTEEVREEMATASSSETKSITSAGSNITPHPPVTPPSSPLLTSLLRSPMATATIPPSATMGFQILPPAQTTSPTKGEMATLTSSPSTTDQLNLDVSTEEVRDQRPTFALASASKSPGLKILVLSTYEEETSAETSPSPGSRTTTSTHLWELPLTSSSNDEPIPEPIVSEETELTTVSTPSKIEVSTKNEEAEGKEPASELLQKTEQAESEPTKGYTCNQEEETIFTKRSEEPNLSMENNNPPSTNQPEDTMESTITNEAEPDMNIEIVASESTIRVEQSEVTLAFESNEEASYSEKVDKNVVASESTIEEERLEVYVAFDSEVKLSNSEETDKNVQAIIEYATPVLMVDTIEKKEPMHKGIKTLKEKEKALEEKEKAVAEKERALKEKEKALVEGDKALEEKEKALKEKEKALKEKEKALEEGDKVLEEIALEEKEKAVEGVKALEEKAIEVYVLEEGDSGLEEEIGDSEKEKSKVKEKKLDQESFSLSEILVHTGTLTEAARSPPQGISKTAINHEDDVPSNDAEPGASTPREILGRKKSQSDEQEAEYAENPAEEESPMDVEKKDTSLPPPLYVSWSSPVPSSGVDSAPNSPPTLTVTNVVDEERNYKTWKKSILSLWRDISSHKNASLFAKPVSEESVPGYHSLVMRPMDLSTIKKNIESGAIRSTTEFQRDISLMFFNSIVYNQSHHEIYRLAKEMYAECTTIIQEFVNAQLDATHSMESLRPGRRETRDLARRTESLSSHEETPVKQEVGKTRAAKRASAAGQVDDNAAVKTKRRSRAQNPE